MKKPSSVTLTNKGKVTTIKKTIKKTIELIDPVVEECQTLLLYGKAGTGKTTIAATMEPPVLILDTKETGYQSIVGSGAKVFRANTWSKLLEAIEYVNQDNHFKTVVVDTITGLQDLRMLEETGKKMAATYGGLGRQAYGKIAGDIKNVLYDFKDLTDKERENRKNVVYLAHMKAFNVDEGEDDEMTPEINALLMPSICKALNGMADIIGNTFITMKEVRTKEKKGNRVLNRTKRVYQFCLRLGPNPVYTTKMRVPIGTIIPPYIVDPHWSKIKELMKGK